MFPFVAVSHYRTHMDATNVLIDSQAMVERILELVCYITAKSGDNLRSGSAIMYLHIFHNAPYLPSLLPPPPPQKKKKIE